MRTPTAERDRTESRRGVARGWARGLVLACGAAVVLIAGCAQGGKKPSPVAVNSGLDALASDGGELNMHSEPVQWDGPLTDEQKKALVAEAAVDLEKLLNGDKPNASGAGSGAGSNTEPMSAGLGTYAAAGNTPAASATNATGTGATGTDGATMNQASETAPAVGSAVEPVVAANDDAMRQASQVWAKQAQAIREPGAANDPGVDLAQRMAAMLRERDANGKPRVSDAVALAAVENAIPGAIATLNETHSTLGGKLTPRDRATLIEARDRLMATPGAVDSQLASALQGIVSANTVQVTRAALCTKVMGFGRYDAFASNSFIAGRPIRAIVYTELDGFGTRPAKQGDPVQKNASISEQVSVELSQSLSLYSESGLLAWHRPAQRVIETTRQKRRDFYLIHQIELPGTLSLGTYSLKVTVEDASAGTTTEAMLPIHIVADGSVLNMPK